MRIEPPVPQFTPWEASDDVSIGKGDDEIRMKKGQKMFIFVNEIHDDPQQWREPKQFNPERFNRESEWYLTPDGKQRDPLSFCPFMGGKRVCLGKTLAETVIRFTIPLIFYHLEMDFATTQKRDEEKRGMSQLLAI